MTATVAPRGGCTRGIVICEVEGVRRTPTVKEKKNVVVTLSTARAHTHTLAHTQTRLYSHWFETDAGGKDYEDSKI